MANTFNHNGKVVITSGGNVGIGTTSPAEKLHVNGSARFVESITIRNASDNSSAAIGNIGASSASLLSFAVGPSPTMVVGTDVGIGTTSPASQLSGTRGLSIVDATNAALGLSNGTNNWLNYLSGTTYRIWNNTSNEVMTITLAGNVGIGTTSPSDKLHVSGSGNTATFITGSGCTTYIQSVATETRIGNLSSGGGSIVFAPADAERMRITSAGNVGIGTASPTAKLHIVQSNGGGVAAILLSEDESTIQGPSANTQMRMGGNLVLNASSITSFGTNGSERMRITSAGNVGIGTTAPDTNLEVAGNVHISGNSTNRLDLDSEVRITGQYYVNNGTEYTYLNMYNGANASINMGTKHPLSYISFESGNGAYTERMRITNSGNVGIGTTAPSEKLHVDGNLGLGTDPSIKWTSNTLTFIPFGDYIPVIKLGGTTTYSPRFDMWNAGDAVKVVSINAGGSSYINSGNVGIGTTSPARKLTVYDASDVVNGQLRLGYSDDYYWELGRDGSVQGRLMFVNKQGGAVSELMSILPSGNVGIGTTSPSTKLQVIGASRVLNVSSSDDQVPASFGCSTGGVSTIGFYAVGSANDYNVRIGANVDAFVAYTNDTERMRITSAGNVGIGTTSPSYKLQVNSDAGGYGIVNTNGTVIIGTYIEGSNNYASFGTQSNHGLGFFTNNAAPQMYINTTGNIGIGTTSPSAKLHVYETTAGIGGVLVGNASNSTSAYSAVTLQSDYPHSYYPGLFLNSSTNTAYAGVDQLMLYQFHSKPIALVTNNIVRLTVTGGGNVGIGTTSPSGKLELYTATGNTTLFVTTTGGGTYVPKISLDKRGDSAWNISSPAGGFNFNIDQDGSSRLWISSVTGNVGIGTTSPSYKLDVNVASNSDALRVQQAGASRFILNGDGVMTWGVSAANGVLTWDTNIAYIGGLTNNALGIYAGGSEKVRITTGGNVGIGTTSPTNTLDVLGSATIRNSSGGGALNIGTNSGRTEYQYITLGGGTVGTDYGWQVGRSPQTGGVINDGFYIYDIKTNNAPFTIALGGNVGIGTTSPAEKLHVSGSTRINGTIYSGDGSISANNSLQLVYSAASGIGTIAAKSTGGNTTLALQTADSGTTTDRLYIASNGNVGIGTTSPVEKLDVRGGAYINGGTNDNAYDATLYVTANSSNDWGIFVSKPSHDYGIISQVANGSDFGFSVYDGTTHNFRVKGNGTTLIQGNVGIGTTSPSEKLHVDGSVVVTYNSSYQGINSVGNKAILARVSPTTGIINYAEYATATNLNGFVMGSDDARVKGNIATDSLEFITNGSTQVTVLSNGNVGIANTNPSEKLSVTGNIRMDNGAADGPQLVLGSSGFSDWNIDNFSGSLRAYYGSTEYTRLTSSGNFGIGVSPSYKLDVAGDTRITSGSLGVGVVPNATDGRIDASNDIVAYSTSDQRLKENVTPIENALEKVKTLTGVEFDWKEETAHVHGYHGHDVGIIAQDVQAVLPEAVRTNDSGYLSVRYEKMIALLIEANKELAARVEELEKKLK